MWCEARPERSVSNRGGGERRRVAGGCTYPAARRQQAPAPEYEVAEVLLVQERGCRAGRSDQQYAMAPACYPTGYPGADQTVRLCGKALILLVPTLGLEPRAC